VSDIKKKKSQNSLIASKSTFYFKHSLNEKETTVIKSKFSAVRENFTWLLLSSSIIQTPCKHYFV